MTNSSYILADDLSGALETGAVFRSRGWRVTLPMDAAAVEPPAHGELQVVSTETRGESPERAAASVRAVVSSRKKAGSRLLFKKIDSTLRGSVAAELAAVIDELKPPLVVVCPANPAAGRVVRRGELFVNGTPLAETDFKNDPQWPARSSRVGDAIAAPGGSPVVELPLEVVRDHGAEVMLSAMIAEGRRLAIADAETEDDLRTIVRAVRRVEPRALLVGSGAFASSLALEMPPADAAPPAVGWRRCRSVLIICGSANPRSLDQLDHLAAGHGVSVITFAADEPDSGVLEQRVVESLHTRRLAAARFTMQSEGTADSTRELQEFIGAFARSVLSKVSVDGLVLTGGETAWTVCREIRGTRFEVIAEVEPGVVLSTLMRADSEPLLVGTKPGGFGSAGALWLISSAMMK